MQFTFQILVPPGDSRFIIPELMPYPDIPFLQPVHILLRTVLLIIIIIIYLEIYFVFTLNYDHLGFNTFPIHIVNGTYETYRVLPVCRFLQMLLAVRNPSIGKSFDLFLQFYHMKLGLFYDLY